MTKHDRKAIAGTIIAIILNIGVWLAAADSIPWAFYTAPILSFSIICYWLYRYVQGDISFLGMEKE